MFSSPKDLEKTTVCALPGRVSWIRHLMDPGIVHNMQWCDTRDMTADGHTKGAFADICSYKSWEVRNPSSVIESAILLIGLATHPGLRPPEE
eukprot:3324192-Pyramimonas_sp.AAC.3